MAVIRSPNDLVLLLKARRAELGESQAKFAERIRKTQAWVSEFERGVAPNTYVGTILEVLSLAGITLEAASSARPQAVASTDDADLAIDFEDEPKGFSP